MSMNSNNNYGMSQSASAKGRISQVIAQARASLKEPSRPITPASFDNRSSLDSAVTSQRKRTSKVESIHRSIALYSNRNAPESTAPILGFSLENRADIAGSPTFSSSVLDIQGMHLLLCDIRDLVNYLDTNLDKSQMQQLQIMLERLSTSVDSIAKTVKDEHSSKRRETHVFCKELFKECLRILGKDQFSERIRYTAARQLWRLLQSLWLVDGDLISDLCVMLHKVTSATYALRSEGPSSSGNLRDSFQRNGSDRENAGTNALGTGRSSSGRSLVGSGSSSPAAEDVLLDLDFVDLVLEFLATMWSRLAGLILRAESDFASASESDWMSSPRSPRIGSQLSTNQVSAGEALLHLMDAASYASGIVKLYSIEEMNRKRLLHLGVVAKLLDGLRASGNAANLCSPAVDSATSRPSNNAGGEGRERRSADSAGEEDDGDVQQDSDEDDNDSEDDPDSAARDSKVIRWKEEFVSKLAQVLVQSTAILRNMSLDSAGRTQLLECEVLGTLCRILRPFKEHDELVLNCVRVSAKLSLLEPFRGQINKKSIHIVCLTEVLIAEAERCQRAVSYVRNEGFDNSTDVIGREATSWPRWYTWPLLSRIAFTLANLTTSNDANRTIIGVKCKSLKPIVLLLQACVRIIMEMVASAATSVQETVSGTTLGRGRADSEDREDLDQANSAAIARQSEGNQEIWDATIKLLRLLANICIDETIGIALSKRPEGLQMLNELLRCLKSGSSPTSPASAGNATSALALATLVNPDISEELLLNVVAACTNITFYACQPDTGEEGNKKKSSSRAERDSCLVDMAHLLANCLFHDNEEIVLETARALGNLTRSPEALHSLASSRMGETLVVLLSHSNRDVVTAVTGTLVNLSADLLSRQALLRAEHISVSEELVMLLRKTSLKELHLSSLVCQVFHNLLLEEHCEVLTDQTGQLLLDTLEELVDCAKDLAEPPSQDTQSAPVRRGSKSSDLPCKYTQFVLVANSVLRILLADAE